MFFKALSLPIPLITAKTPESDISGHLWEEVNKNEIRKIYTD